MYPFPACHLFLFVARFPVGVEELSVGTPQVLGDPFPALVEGAAILFVLEGALLRWTSEGLVILWRWKRERMHAR